MAKGTRASDSSSSGGGTGGASQLRLELIVDSTKATKDIKKATKAINNELKLTKKEVDKTGKLFKNTFARSIPDSFKKANSALNNFAQNNKKQIRFIRIQFKALKTEAMALRSALTTVYTGITGLLVGRQIQQSFRAAATKELAAARTGEVSELFGANTAEIQKGILDLRREGLFTYGALAYSARQLASMNLQVEGSIEDMLRAFRNIAVVEGFYEDINFSITSFIKGIQTGTAELLENLSPRIRTMIVDMGGFAKIQQDVNLRNELLNNILRDGKVQQEAYNRVAATSEIRLKKLQTRYTELLETFGEGLLPVFNDFADLMDNVVRNLTAFFSSLDDSEKRAAALTATFTTLTLLLAGPFLATFQLITALFRTGITLINTYARALQGLYSIMVAVMAIKAPIAAVLTALIGIAGALGAFFGIKGVMDSVTESLTDTSNAAEKAYDQYNNLTTEIANLNIQYIELEKSLLKTKDAVDGVDFKRHQQDALRAAQVVETLKQKNLELMSVSRKLALEGAGIREADLRKEAAELGVDFSGGISVQAVQAELSLLQSPGQAKEELKKRKADKERELEKDARRARKFSRGEDSRLKKKLELEEKRNQIAELEKRINNFDEKNITDQQKNQAARLGLLLQETKKYKDFLKDLPGGGGTQRLSIPELQELVEGDRSLRGNRLPGILYEADAGPDANIMMRSIAELQGTYFDTLEGLSQFIINKTKDLREETAAFGKELNKFKVDLKVPGNVNVPLGARTILTDEGSRKLKAFSSILVERQNAIDEVEKQLKALLDRILKIAETRALEQINASLNSFSSNLESVKNNIKNINDDTLGSFVDLAKSLSGVIGDLGTAAFESGIIGAKGAAAFGAASAGLGFVGASLGIFDVLFGDLLDNSQEQIKELERQRALQEAQNNYLKTLVDLEIDRQKSEREGLDREVDRLESIAERDKAMLEGQFTGEELQKKQIEIDQRLQEDIKNLLINRLGSSALSSVKDLMAADPFAGIGIKGGQTRPEITKRQRISQAIMDREEIERVMQEYQAERGVLVASRAGDAALSELASRTIDRITPLLSPALQEQYQTARRSFSSLQQLGTPGIALNKFFEDFAARNEVDTGILTETLDIMNRLYDLETEGIETNNDLLGAIADNTKAVDLQQAQERGFSFIDISRGGLQQAGLFRGTRMSSLISDITTPTTLGNLVAVTEAKTTQQKMLDTLNDQLSELRIHTALLAKLTNSDPTRQVNDGLTTLSSALKVG